MASLSGPSTLAPLSPASSLSPLLSTCQSILSARMPLLLLTSLPWDSKRIPYQARPRGPRRGQEGDRRLPQVQGGRVQELRVRARQGQQDGPGRGRQGGRGQDQGDHGARQEGTGQSRAGSAEGRVRGQACAPQCRIRRRQCCNVELSWPVEEEQRGAVPRAHL